MDSRRARRIAECRRWQKEIEKELAEIKEEPEPRLRREFAEMSELTHEYEYELNLLDEERLVVLDIPTLSRLVKSAWFGSVLVHGQRDKFVPLAGMRCDGSFSLNETWGHFIIERRILRENMRWFETGAYLVPAGAFVAAVFPGWKTKTLRRILIPQCPLLPVVSYKEYIERLWQEISRWQMPSYP